MGATHAYSVGPTGQYFAIIHHEKFERTKTRKKWRFEFRVFAISPFRGGNILCVGFFRIDFDFDIDIDFAVENHFTIFAP
jgi:hypothetical protein